MNSFRLIYTRGHGRTNTLLGLQSPSPRGRAGHPRAWVPETKMEVFAAAVGQGIPVDSLQPPGNPELPAGSSERGQAVGIRCMVRMRLRKPVARVIMPGF